MKNASLVFSVTVVIQLAYFVKDLLEASLGNLQYPRAIIFVQMRICFDKSEKTEEACEFILLHSLFSPTFWFNLVSSSDSFHSDMNPKFNWALVGAVHAAE